MPDKRSKSKKRAKDAPTFEPTKVKAVGIRYAGQDVYSMKIKAHNAKYSDVYEKVTEIKDILASKFPEARMNVAIKYDSVSKPISAGYFDVDDDVDLKAPYDYHDQDDTVDLFYINWVVGKKLK